MEEFYKIEKVADKLMVTPRTIERWYRAGLIPKPIQHGGPGGVRVWAAKAINEIARGNAA